MGVAPSRLWAPGLSSSFVVINHCFYLSIRLQSRCFNFAVIFLTVTSEDVLYVATYEQPRPLGFSHTKRQVFKILVFLQHALFHHF